MIRKSIAALLVAALVSGCATRGSNYVPLVDTKGVDSAKMAEDVVECQAYAKQRYDEMQGALVGALVGAALGAAVSNKYSGNLTAVGATAGATGSLKGTMDSQERIIARCMAGRGYSVLE